MATTKSYTDTAYSHTDDVSGNFYLFLRKSGSLSIAHTEPKTLSRELVVAPTTNSHLFDDESDSSLTQHAMNLSAASLAADWAEEDDDYWQSLL